MATGIGTAASQRGPSTAEEEDGEPGDRARPRQPPEPRWKLSVPPASSERPACHQHCDCSQPRMRPGDTPMVRSQGARCAEMSGQERTKANHGSWQRPRKRLLSPAQPPPHSDARSSRPTRTQRHVCVHSQTDAHSGQNDIPTRHSTEHPCAQGHDRMLLTVQTYPLLQALAMLERSPCWSG